MPQTASPAFDENALPKGQLRKLTALRKSLGDDIADRAFGQWLKTQAKGNAGAVDRGAKLIEEAVSAMIKKQKLSIPRGGYLLTRGRGRVFVTRTAKD